MVAELERLNAEEEWYSEAQASVLRTSLAIGIEKSSFSKSNKKILRSMLLGGLCQPILVDYQDIMDVLDSKYGYHLLESGQYYASVNSFHEDPSPYSEPKLSDEEVGALLYKDCASRILKIVHAQQV